MNRNMAVLMTLHVPVFAVALFPRGKFKYLSRFSNMWTRSWKRCGSDGLKRPFWIWSTASFSSGRRS